jgi:hypothetical protein
MKPEDLVVPPPTPKLFDYPVTVGIAVGIIATTMLLITAGRFDATGGVLTISLLVTLAFISTVIFCLFFTIPNDEITSAVIGGLTASFGAVVAWWFSNHKGPS